MCTFLICGMVFLFDSAKHSSPVHLFSTLAFRHLLLRFITHAESMRMNERNRTGDRWWDGVILDGMLKPVTTATESFIREQRSTVKQYDEVLETFRQHAYSLRRLILNGSNDRSLNMLRMYFQVPMMCLATHHCPESNNAYHCMSPDCCKHLSSGSNRA